MLCGSLTAGTNEAKETYGVLRIDRLARKFHVVLEHRHGSHAPDPGNGNAEDSLAMASDLPKTPALSI